MTLLAPSATPSASPALMTHESIFKSMEGRFKLRPRTSQLTLASQVRETLANGGVCCIEAPTGTGKTLGYLAGALEYQAHSPFPIPVVVATATVGLQEQILRHDIPRLAAVGAVDLNKVAVAKGRGRYFCPRTAALLKTKKGTDSQFDMFNPDKPVVESGNQIALDMLKAFTNGEWDGDRDNWQGVIPECWDANCGASSDTCVNRACDYFDRCPYMASRARLGQAQVIVANHDMVLADLAQRAEEQQTTALPPKSYALIIDEAHNLPEKAVSTKRASARLTESDWLRGLNEFGDRCLSTPRIEKLLTKTGEFRADIFSAGSAQLLSGLENLAKHFLATRTFDLSGVSSWGLEEPEQALKELVWEHASLAREILNALKACSKAFADFAEEAVGADKGFAISMLAETHKFTRHVKDLQAGLELFCVSERLVRWVYRKDDKVILQSQPLEGRDVLTELLWKREMPVALVSATLQIAGSFSRYKDKSGLPSHAVTAALPPVFDYTRGFLHQPRMDTEPSNPGFEAELADKLKRLYDNKVAQGTLVLFTSRESMRRVVRLLPDEMLSRARIQDHRPLPELVAQHKEAIDTGERSILIGLDSMAEGLDLPGKYCGHVVITRLPFAVPGDPVEEARRLHLGKSWFEQAYLADMLTMLIQAAGRLIRREEDHGVITVLDKRLSTKRYALTAMKALPGFTRGTNLQGYFDMREERKLDSSAELKPAKKIELVHSAPDTPARPAPSKSAPKPATKKEAEAPLAALWRLRAVPVATGKPEACSIETLTAIMAKNMPLVTGPFEEGEPEFLSKTRLHPCLPPGAPAYVWGERQMPQAVMLGLRLMNMDWDESKPGWFQVLSLRPDLVQFAEILRSHELDRADPRRPLISLESCELQLTHALAGLNAPRGPELYKALTTLESEAILVLGGSHKQPNRDFMVEMPQAALKLAVALRKSVAA